MRKKPKILLISIFSLLIIVPYASSYEISSDDQTIEYGEENSVEVVCPFGQCTQDEEQYSLNVCGGDYGVSESATKDSHRIIFDVYVPYESDSDREVRCPVGEYDAIVAGQNAGELNIEHGHEGGFDELHITQDRYHYHYGHLIEEFEGASGNSGEVRVEQSGTSFVNSDADAVETFDAPMGEILSTRTVDNLGEYLGQTASDPEIQNVLDDDWDSDMNSGCGGSCVFTHETESGNADYSPDGEIIYGEKFESEFEPIDRDSSQFHYCHEGDQTTWNTYVYSPGTNYNDDYFKCETDGEWENYDADRQCTDPAVGMVQQRFHFPGFGTFYSGFQKGVMWGLSDEGASYRDGENTECYYNSADREIPGEFEDGEYRTPNIFYCTPDSTIFGSEYETELLHPDEDRQAYAEDRWNQAQEYCETLNIEESLYEEYGGEIPVAEYFVPKDLIPYSIQDRSAAEDYASFDGNYQGLTNHRYQNLHEAKAEFYNVDQPQNISTWEERNMTSLLGYEEGEDNEDKTLAWEAVRGGGHWSTNVQSPTNLEDDAVYIGSDEDVFPGGWSGNCEGGHAWQNIDVSDDGPGSNFQWTCEDGVPWEFEVFMPAFNFNDDDTEENATIGFHLLPENFQETPQQGVDEFTQSYEKTEWAYMASVDPGYLSEENITSINEEATDGGINSVDALIKLRTMAEQNGWIDAALDLIDIYEGHEALELDAGLDEFSSPQYREDSPAYFLYPREGWSNAQGTPSPYIRDGCYNNLRYHPVDYFETADQMPEDIEMEHHNRSFMFSPASTDHQTDCPSWITEGAELGDSGINPDNLPTAIENRQGEVISKESFSEDRGRFFDSVRKEPLGEQAGYDESNAAVEKIYAVCWYGGRDRVQVLDEVHYGDRWFGAEIENIPDQPMRPIPIISELDKDEASDFNGVTCRFVLQDENDHTWRALGNTEQTGVDLDPIDDLAEQRNYWHDSDVDLGETMQPSEFEEISNEWVQENNVEINVKDPEEDFNLIPRIPSDKENSEENNEYLRGELEE